MNEEIVLIDILPDKYKNCQHIWEDEIVVGQNVYHTCLVCFLYEIIEIIQLPEWGTTSV